MDLKHTRTAFLTLLLLLGLTAEVSAQFFYGTRQTFGKNRVQFNEFDWVFLRFDRYDVYFYRGNDQLAEKVAYMANRNLAQIENFFDAPLDERVQILVFNNLTDLKQSNVNSSSEEDYNTGGTTRISGRRLFLHFTGDYSELESQLRGGLTEVVLSNLIYGSFTESLKNSTLLNLPEWYIEGLISYMGDRWSTQVDAHIRDGFYSNKYKRINALNGFDARYAGHSIWYYIADIYGENIVKNIVYMAVLNRDIETGFTYILGKDLEEVTREWKAFYADRYNFENEAPFEEKPLIKAPKHHKITHMEASPDGRYLVYVIQRFSRYKIYLYDLENNKKKRILTEGYRIAQNADYSYPLLAWHPNGEILAMFTEEKGVTHLGFYNLETGKIENKQPYYRFDKILSYEYSPDGKQFLMSAVKNGQSDIFVYTLLNTKIDQITNDSYDDLHPTFFDGSKRIAWSSNRPVDTLYPQKVDYAKPKSSNDIFATLNRPLDKDTVKLWRLTQSPGVDEREVQRYAPSFLTFLTDRSGHQGRNLIKIDSSIAYVDTITHYSYSFSEYQASAYENPMLDQAFFAEKDLTTELYLWDNRYRIYSRPYQSPEDLNLVKIKKPLIVDNGTEEESLDEENAEVPLLETDVPLYYPGVSPQEFEVNIYNYDFGGGTDESRPRKQKPKPKPVQVLPIPLIEEDEAKDTLEIPRKRNYFLSFYKDEFTVRFDNMFDNPQYQKFTGFISSDILNSGFNMNFKVGTIDLMHDYRIIAGTRFTFQPLAGTSLAPNAEFFVGLGDYKDRLDKEYVFSRRSQMQYLAFNDFQRLISNEIDYKLTWPFNPVASLRGTLGYRLDQNITLSKETISIDEPTQFDQFAIARLSFVYDNTRKIGVNLYAGTRYKIFTEYYRQLDISPTGLHTAGIDFRKYIVIHRNMIWANRFAAGASFGPQKLIYIMGGTDNAFGPKFEPTTPFATENNYIFQTLVTNMRGFYQNVRNGDKFAVINTELRWPVFSYFAKNPIRSDFIKNFQVIGFTDVGTAWNGPSPYDRENVINTRTVSRQNLEVILDSQKEPIVAGVGFGLRSRLFGYFIRADWAWGIEDGIVLPREFYISLATDF